MRVVLYTEDFEPITVIDLNPAAYNLLSERSFLRLAVQEPIRFTHVSADDPIDFEPPRIVELRCERLRRGGQEHLMLFTRQEENALLLEAAFLPGQTRAVNEEKAKAFARGFVRALQALG